MEKENCAHVKSALPISQEMKKMKKAERKVSVAIILMAVAIFVGMLSPVYAETYPQHENFIADTAGVISEVTARTIRNSNEEISNSAGAVIAVCTVSTTGDTAIGEYARGVFRDWKLGESILILIAVDDMNYYFLQSTAIDEVLTNEELSDIVKEYLENDFVAGNIDTGVMKVVAKLSSILGSRMHKTEGTDSPSQNVGTTLGDVIVGFFKVILYIVLIAIAAFIVLFVVALFNDNVAAFMRKYIFRTKPQKTAPRIRYDERLYGGRQRRPVNQQQRADSIRSYSENRQPRRTVSGDRFGNYSGYDDYFAKTQSLEEPYYNADGTRRK